MGRENYILRKQLSDEHELAEKLLPNPNSRLAAEKRPWFRKPSQLADGRQTGSYPRKGASTKLAGLVPISRRAVMMTPGS